VLFRLTRSAYWGARSLASFLLLTSSTALFAHNFSESRERPTRPNIVFIITDDQRWDYLGLAGHPVLKTPNIDRIGEEGVWMKNCFTITPLCSPSRASFLTGLYPHRHAVVNNDRLGLDVISHRLLTWPRQLREAGYATAFVGKWHMGLDDSRRPGFDFWVSFKGQGAYIDGVANEDGVRRQLTGYMTDYLNDRAVEFIRLHRNQPFALVISHKAVHYPYLPAQRHDSLYEDYSFQLPRVSQDELASKPMLTRKIPGFRWYELEGIAPEPGESRRGRGSEPTSIVRDQLRSLASVDEGVGRVMAVLAELGQLDSTVIIYTSDNGYLMGEHDRFNDKRWAYDPSIRIPLLIRFPPLIAPGSTRQQLVLNIDIAPTLMELAGVTPLEPMHGESIVSLFHDAQAQWRDAILTEYFLEKVAPRVPSWQCVRSERWKYIRYTGEPDSFDELYDIQSDPGELVNLARDASAKGNLHEMKGRLEAMLKQFR
jgi:N-acetylglucosamine-6-sulfatase